MMVIGSLDFCCVAWWFSFVSSGFWDFGKWVFGSLNLGRLMMVAWWWWWWWLDFCCVAWLWWLGRLTMDLWIFGGWLMVAWLNGYVNFIDGSLVEWDGGWVVVWLDDGGWVVRWWWLCGLCWVCERDDSEKKWIFYWINVYNREIDVRVL